MIKRIEYLIICVVATFCIFGCSNENLDISDNTDLKKGLTTAVEFDKVFDADVDSLDEAIDAIREYGELQRDNYKNKKINKIEKRLEDEYGIIAVNLGEIDYDTAKDIEKACDYMFNEYPELNGRLTNLSIANFHKDTSGAIALTETREFIINESYGVCPFVVKYQIILNAAKFLKRDKLIATCNEQVEAGHWPEGTNITSLVVHELGHQVLDVIAMKEYGLIKDGIFNGIYITDENQDSFSFYVTDSLSANQQIPQKVLSMSYENWCDNYGGKGTEEEFRESISEYASGVQSDGGISYTETVAEAVADVYLNEEKASNASKAIVDTLKKNLQSE